MKGHIRDALMATGPLFFEMGDPETGKAQMAESRNGVGSIMRLSSVAFGRPRI